MDIIIVATTIIENDVQKDTTDIIAIEIMNIDQDIALIIGRINIMNAIVITWRTTVVAVCPCLAEVVRSGEMSFMCLLVLLDVDDRQLSTRSKPILESRDIRMEFGVSKRLGFELLR